MKKDELVLSCLGNIFRPSREIIENYLELINAIYDKEEDASVAWIIAASPLVKNKKHFTKAGQKKLELYLSGEKVEMGATWSEIERMMLIDSELRHFFSNLIWIVNEMLFNLPKVDHRWLRLRYGLDETRQLSRAMMMRSFGLAPARARWTEILAIKMLQGSSGKRNLDKLLLVSDQSEKKQLTRDWDLEDLNISPRTFNLLQKAGAEKLSDLGRLTVFDARKILDEEGVDEIRKILRAYEIKSPLLDDKSIK